MCLAGTTAAVHDHASHHEQATHHEHGHDDAPRLGRRALLATGVGAALAATLPGRPAWAGTGRWRARAKGAVDLTHVFRAGFPVYGGQAPSRATLVTIPRDGYYQQEWTFAEHSGTHLDAPGHFVAGRRLADELTAEELMVPAVVVDISDKARRDPDAQVLVEDLLRFERSHGRIPPRAAVLMHSGWAARVHDRAAYRNADRSGVMHFPGFSVEAVEFLLQHRTISAIGVDTLSLDFGPSTTFGVHFRLLGADRYGLENLANLDAMPPRGAHVFVGLVPWEQGSGGPARVLARW